MTLNGQALDVSWDEITHAPLTVPAAGSDPLLVRGIEGMGRGEVQDIGTLLKIQPLFKPLGCCLPAGRTPEE